MCVKCAQLRDAATTPRSPSNEAGSAPLDAAYAWLNDSSDITLPFSTTASDSAAIASARNHSAIVSLYFLKHRQHGDRDGSGECARHDPEQGGRADAQRVRRRVHEEARRIHRRLQQHELRHDSRRSFAR